MATSVEPPPGELPFYKFPPFPTPPPGAKIPVWSEFKQAGIQIAFDPDSDDIERDGRGIPTVRLASKHGLTDGERMKHKSKKLRRTAVLPNGQQVRLQWYEEWDEVEKSRRVSIDPALNRIDRLHEAATAFKSGRSWPPPTPECNPLLIWDYWRLHLGLISSIQSEVKKDKDKPKFDPAEAYDSDEEDVAGGSGDKTTSVSVVDDPEKLKKLEDERRAKQDEGRKPLDENALARKEYFRELREVKKDSFLEDPELCVKIFFSSHWRDRGYIHDTRRCHEGPILIDFFLKFLVRSRVFPEEEAALQRAIAICEIAKKELPATWKLGHALPDKLSMGFEKLNTEMSDGLYGSGFIIDPFGDEDGSDEENEPADDDRDAKKRKLEEAEELCKDDPTVQIIDPEKMDLDAAAHTDALADNVDVNGAEVKPSGWGALEDDAPADQTSGWGAPENDVPVDEGSGWGNTSGWGTTGNDFAWASAVVDDLFKFLGPTALPFTHTTGIVERSTRQIVRVIHPPSAANQAKDVSQAEAVEQELDTRFGKVVLKPWVKVGNHVASDIVPPDILRGSRGAVLVPELTKSDLRNHGIRNGGRASLAAPDAAPRTTGPHAPFDPAKDEITLLVAPETLALLEQHLGMGVCATWVQIARKDRPGDDVELEVPVAKKGRAGQVKGGAPGEVGEPTLWWYMEHVSFVITSFHTDRYYADQED